MAKNDFRVTPVFKITYRICLENVEICGKTSKFLSKRWLLIFCIFYLNEKELNQQVCPIKFIENEISTSHKKRREEQKDNPTSKQFLKLLKNFH